MRNYFFLSMAGMKKKCRNFFSIGLKRKAEGFTMIEVMMALMILFIGVLGIAKMQLTSIDGNAKARKYSDGTYEGAKKIEELMQRNYATLTSGKETVVDAHGISREILWTVTPFGDANFNAKQLSIQVKWVESGKEKMFTAKYYKSIAF